jgi:frataxin-like iron-binding protein CyaY
VKHLEDCNNGHRQTTTSKTKPRQTTKTKKMPAPSPLVIATSVLNRYVKEEKSYHKELEQQSARIAKLEAGEDADNENAEFILRQQVSILFLTIGNTQTVLTNKNCRSKHASRPWLSSQASTKRSRML